MCSLPSFVCRCRRRIIALRREVGAQYLAFSKYTADGRWRRQLVPHGLLLLSVLGIAMTAEAASYVVTDLGTLGGASTYGWGLNSSGQATGYSVTLGDEIVNSFLWNPTTANGASGTIHDLGGLGGQFSWGIGINGSGQVSGIAATLDDEAEHATLWNPSTPGGFSGTLHDLGTLGGTYSQGTGINDLGQLTGYSDLTGDEEWHAMLWQPTTPNSATGLMHDIGPSAVRIPSGGM